MHGDVELRRALKELSIVSTVDSIWWSQPPTNSPTDFAVFLSFFTYTSHFRICAIKEIRVIKKTGEYGIWSCWVLLQHIVYNVYHQTWLALFLCCRHLRHYLVGIYAITDCGLLNVIVDRANVCDNWAIKLWFWRNFWRIKGWFSVCIKHRHRPFLFDVIVAFTAIWICFSVPPNINNLPAEIVYF